MVTQARMLPPIRADTANGHGEPQLLKKRLKTENLRSRRNVGVKIILEETNNDYEAQ